MRSARLLGCTLTLVALSPACAKPTHAAVAADGNAVTSSGQEIPKPMSETDLPDKRARSR